jgi:prepilin peptidase CpaA
MAEATALAFAGFLLVAAVTDLRALRIPNALVALGLAVAVARLLLTPAPLWPHLGLGLVAFAVTFALFAANLIGGGDAKLFPVAVLWFGPVTTPPFLLVLSLAAAAFALVLVAARLVLAAIDRRPERWPLVLRRGGGVPLAVPTLSAALPFL